MESNLTVSPGDDVGTEVIAQALSVLEAVGEKYGHSLNFNEGRVGGVATDTLDESLSYEVLCVIVGYAEAELELQTTWNLI
jgi:isocitrate/isopropylmalate dehydrogenase